MSRELHERAGEVFLRLRAVGREGRAAAIEEVCRGDAALRAEVESLLSHDGVTVELKPDPVSAPAPDDRAGDAARGRPERIGPFRIVGLLGEGGMGVVYEARQDHPSRTVALKVMRTWSAGRALVHRFQFEVHLLGLLKHPGIAQIYEAGTEETGIGPRPWFAMEYIRGSPLLQFADQHHLGRRARLELFLKVCEAVQFAHQKGVIHRDLKPGNILVEESEGSAGQPKILDFGVARATHSDMQLVSMRTETGPIVGTLAYMSPEQVAARPDELDTRSDVYSLGVILFELLCGRRPYELADLPITEAARVIRDEDPASLGTLDRSLRGDLETIVAKALEKERERRYQSAAELAADIRRYLAHEPIAARPASTFYQLGKFARRNRALVASAVVIFVAMAVATVVSAAALVQAVAARRHAEREADKALRAMDFMTGMLASADPERDGADVRVIQILDRAAADVGAKFPGHPEAEASARYTLGVTYTALGKADPAAEHLRRAAELRAASLGPSHPDTLDTRIKLAEALKDGRHLPEAENEARSVLAEVGPERSELRFRALHQLGQIRSPQSDAAGAEAAFREAMDLAKRSNEPVLEATAAGSLGSLLEQQKRLEEAEPLLELAAQTMLSEHGPEADDTLTARRNLATLLAERRNVDGAERHLLEIIEIRRRVYGADHPDTFSGVNSLAKLYVENGRHVEAAPLFREALESARRTLREDDPRIQTLTGNLAVSYYMSGQYAEAEPIYRAVLANQRSRLGPGHTSTLTTMNNLARALHRLGQLEESSALYEELIRTAREHVPPQQIFHSAIAIGYAPCLIDLKRFEDAERTLLEAFATVDARVGRSHDYTRRALDYLVTLYTAWDKPDEAQRYRAMLDAAGPPLPVPGASTAP